MGSKGNLNIQHNISLHHKINISLHHNNMHQICYIHVRQSDSDQTTKSSETNHAVGQAQTIVCQISCHRFRRLLRCSRWTTREQRCWCTLPGGTGGTTSGSRWTRRGCSRTQGGAAGGDKAPETTLALKVGRIRNH